MWRAEIMKPKQERRNEIIIKGRNNNFFLAQIDKEKIIPIATKI